MPYKCRILIVTDSPLLPTGLAETTRLIFCNLIRKYPEFYDLHQIGLFHCYAVTQPSWPIHPTKTMKDVDGKLLFAPEDKYAQRTFSRLLPRLQPDIVFGFGDPQRMPHLCLPRPKRNYRLILYLNFDGMPLPQAYAPVLQNADLIF